MKKVRISLDEKLAACAAQLAARRNISLSRFVGELLEETMRESREYERAMRAYFFGKPVTLKRGGARFPSRDQLHGHGRLR